MVVILIIMLVSAVTLPTIIPALESRQVGEAARIVQAALAGARDAAIRANAPHGIRLLPDPALPLACNRLLPIETAPDYTDGSVTFPPQPPFVTTAMTWAWTSGSPPTYQFPLNPLTGLPVSGVGGQGSYPYVPTLNPPRVLMVMEAIFQTNTAPLLAVPTNWFWNVRVGDKIRFNNSGRSYTIVGPMTIPNPEWFVNDGTPGSSTLAVTYVAGPQTQINTTVNPEYLFLVNGIDDNGNGYVDEGFDGVDQNLNGVFTTNPPFPNADDIGEWATAVNAATPEVETWQGSQAIDAIQIVPPVRPYAIIRRPVPMQGAREVALPAGAVIDLTTYNTTRERSRLPDPIQPNGAIDILINPSGQVVPTTAYSTPSSFRMDQAFFHFWIADRTDVVDPLPPPSGSNYAVTLPIPAGSPNEPSNGARVLKRDRQLVTLFARTGNVTTNSIEQFDGTNVNVPFLDAEHGTRETK